jgi:two-component system, chemotaxis family, sensor kinase CheA
MDDLLREFLTETNESLDLVDAQLVRFEREPANAQILAHIFRLVHTIKGTCGFLGLPRLESLSHAAETLMGRFRDGMPVTAEAVSVVLATIDRLKQVLGGLERDEREPEGADADLIGELERLAAAAPPATAAGAPKPAEAEEAAGSLVYQVLERPLRPGEVSLDELERAFRETPVDPAGAATAARPAGEDGEKSEGKVAGQSIRVHVDTLEKLMTMVSELVLTRNQLLEIARRHEDSEFKSPLQRLSNVTAELQEGVMKTRMQPIGQAWQKLPRIVRDLASELGKEIELELHGSDTELDRQVLDLIKDPLTHMVRNSADHGLETAGERRSAGKPEKGTIRLSAYHEGGQIFIEAADDGRGLNTEHIKAKAVTQGLVSAADAEKLTEAQIHQFIFAPGFSTAAAVTSVSGRGVGMDVVRNNIDQIGGTIDVKSVYGEGSSFTLKIPLTLAIVSALIVETAGERFAIPQLSVVELVQTRANSEHRIERIRDTAVLRLRDKLLPLVNLRGLLKLEAESAKTSDDGFVVVMQVGSQTFGVVVDGVFHTEEIVVKPVSSKLRHIGMFSGNTILGDGSVIMIIDPNGIAQALGTAAAVAVKQINAESKPAAAAEKRVSLLVFRAGSPQPKAVPLSLVTRLEEIDCGRIEIADGRHVVQYRGGLMPVLPANANVRVKEHGAQPLLVFSEGGRTMGIMVDAILDIVDDTLDLEVGSATPGVLGSAIVKGQAAEILDVGHFLPLAFADWYRAGAPRKGATAGKLLFVDDSAFFRDMLEPVLRAAGYDVTTAVDAAEALGLVEKGAHFDVVVTDIDMPGMNGFDFAEALRRMPRSAHVAIIGLAAMTSAALIERGRKAGIQEFVAKFDRHSLIAALRQSTAEWEQAA